MIVFEQQGTNLKIRDDNKSISPIIYLNIGIFIGQEKLLCENVRENTITIKNFDPPKLFQQLINCMSIKEYKFIKIN